MSDINKKLTDVIQNAIKAEIAKPRIIRAANGDTKSTSGKFGPYSYAPISTGLLYESVNVYVESDLQAGDFTLVVDFSPADYAQYILEGREAGQRIFKTRLSKNGKTIQYPSYTKFPPLQAIKDWITNKPVASYRDRLGQILTPDAQAFIIGRAIARDGQYPYDFLEMAFQNIEEEVLELLGEKALEFLESYLNKGVKIIF